MTKKTAWLSFALVACAAVRLAAVDAPLLFAVLDIGSAQSLPWTAPANYLGIRDDYDVHHVVADTSALLTPATPTIVRMETLRRAAVYASRDREVARQLVAFVVGRVTVLPTPGPPEPIALFDAGYVIEVLKELQEFGLNTKTLWALDRTIVGITRPYDGRALLEQSAALCPGDGSIQLALALLTPSSVPNPHLRQAQAAAEHDALLANSMARLQLLQ
jgi:hypothetical protein